MAIESRNRSKSLVQVEGPHVWSTAGSTGSSQAPQAGEEALGPRPAGRPPGRPRPGSRRGRRRSRRRSEAVQGVDVAPLPAAAAGWPGSRCGRGGRAAAGSARRPPQGPRLEHRRPAGRDAEVGASLASSSPSTRGGKAAGDQDHRHPDPGHGAHAGERARARPPRRCGQPAGLVKRWSSENGARTGPAPPRREGRRPARPRCRGAGRRSRARPAGRTAARGGAGRPRPSPARPGCWPSARARTGWRGPARRRVLGRGVGDQQARVGLDAAVAGQGLEGGLPVAAQVHGGGPAPSWRVSPRWTR